MTQSRNKRRHQSRNRQAAARRRAQRSGGLRLTHGRSLFAWDYRRDRATLTWNPHAENITPFDDAFGHLGDVDDQQFAIWPGLAHPDDVSGWLRDMPREDLVGDLVFVDVFCEHIREEGAAHYRLLDHQAGGELRARFDDPDYADFYLIVVAYPGDPDRDSDG